MNTRDGATQDRPSESQVPLQTRLENARKWLKLLREIVIDVSAITAFASAIIGFILIRVYLSNFSISISPIDTFGASSLQIFVFFFVAGLGSAVFVFLLPFWATFIVPPETRDSLPDLFGRRYVPPDTVQPRRGHGTFPDIKFLKEYAIFYLPTLGFLILSSPLIVYFQILSEKISPWMVLLLFIISGLLLSRYKLKGRPKGGTVYSLLWLNGATLIWMGLLLLGMARSLEYAGINSIIPAWQAIIELSVVLFLAVLCHMFMAWAKLSISALAGFAVILLLVFAAYPGYAAIGAAALRAAWLGGGTRISYTTVGPGAATSEPTSGCLILATTSYVLVGELDDKSCPSLSRFWFKAPEVKPRPVRVFSRGEIKISEPPGG